MKFSTILIIAGIVLAVIGIGIVFMDNVQADDIHKNNVQVNNGQTGEPKDKPRLVNLDEAAKNVNNAYTNKPPRIDTSAILFLFGIVMVMAGIYDARRTSSVEKNEPPGFKK